MGMHSGAADGDLNFPIHTLLGKNLWPRWPFSIEKPQQGTPYGPNPYLTVT
ncbi:hypothetical protein SAMN05444414_1476 [Roseovarius marisflavi]|uniref:Uncharacterized protein n=1 Tax=Roseovarius marisflavi TaxID=1054996 RepID=A0A1M7DQW5_9RHOB|nr:hypothetical protein SAMN05444414_1476 [Roseovarius marisflavi]